MSEHAKPVKTTALLFAGVLAALCWTVGDMLLVGFVPQPERHPQLAALTGRMEGDVQMAALMLDAAPERLWWGVVPATFSTPLYLAAAFGVYRLLRPGRMAVWCFALLFGGYALAPLAHAGFYYLGSAAQALDAACAEGAAAALARYNSHYRLLGLHWAASVGMLALGWLLFLFQAACGRSALPRKTAWLTPLPAGIAIAAACSAFPLSETAALIGGATFNLTQLLFYAAALLQLRRRQAA